jgi:hypothetical protein
MFAPNIREDENIIIHLTAPKGAAKKWSPTTQAAKPLWPCGCFQSLLMFSVGLTFP